MAGEKAPYQVQQDIRQHQEHQDIQHKKAGNMARKRKINDQSVSNEVQSNLLPGSNAGTIGNIAINEQQVIALQRAVGPDILALALDQAGPGASLDQVQTKLKALLS